MGPKKVLSSFEPKKKVSSFSNYLNVPRSLSRRKKSSPSLSLSLSFSKRARTFAEKRVKTTKLCGCWCSSFFSEEDSSLLGQRTRTRVKCGFESEEKERSEMYKVDERVFFLFVERERARAHHPVPKEKNF